MILYSDLLIHPDSNSAPVLSGYEIRSNSYHVQNVHSVNWIRNSLDEMRARNFRPRQITICEAYVALAHYRCQNFNEAYDYFMKSLDYKVRNLPEDLIFSFSMCGIDNMKRLNKKEELLQFYKIRSQYGSNSVEAYVWNMIELFELDWELYR